VDLLIVLEETAPAGYGARLNRQAVPILAVNLGGLDSLLGTREEI